VSRGEHVEVNRDYRVYCIHGHTWGLLYIRRLMHLRS
jgi:hypothetical protein